MYIQASMELDVSLLERCPHFRRCYVYTGFNGVGCVPIREVSSFQKVLCLYKLQLSWMCPY